MSWADWPALRSGPRWAAVFLFLLMGCNSGTAPPLGPDADPDALPAHLGRSNGGAAAPGPPPGTFVLSGAPGQPLPKKWTPGDPGVKELSQLEFRINLDPKTSFDELSAKFAQARADKKVLPSGECELELLYDAAMRTPFRGKWDTDGRIAFCKEWRAAKPEDPAPLILIAKIYHALGWDARGSGTADQVTDQGMRVFHQRLQEGLEYAQEAEKLVTPDPELYAMLIRLGQGLSVKKKHFDAWVEAGSKIQPNYFSLYESAAFNLLPRWHGEPGDVEQLADSLYARIGGDDGAEAYARCAMAVMPYDRDILYAGQFDMRKVLAGAEVMGRRYPQETSLLPFLTVMAWIDQNQPLARKYLERYIKAGQPESNIINFRYNQIYGFCEAECPPDKPDFMHWPYMNRAEQIVYTKNGQGFITLPSANFEMVRIWDRDNLQGPRALIPEFKEKVTALQSDTTGDRLILSFGSLAQSVDISLTLGRDEKPVVYQAPAQRLGTALSPDGKLAATCRQSTITIWDPASGQPVLDLPGEFEHAVMKFSPDSQRLLVVARGSTELFDPTNGNLLHKYTPGTGVTMNRVEHFADAQTLVGYGNSSEGVPGMVKWFPDEKKVVEFTREGVARYVTLSDVSRNYVLCSETGRLGSIFHLYRLSDGKLVRTVDGHQSRVTSAVISPNESEFATVDLSGPIKFWKIPK